MRLFLVAVVCAVSSLPALAADWEACAFALDTLNRRAAESEAAVGRVALGAESVRAAQADLETCRVYRGTSDPWDKCTYNLRQVATAEEAHRTALAEAKPRFERLKRAIAEAESDCGLEPEPSPPEPAAPTESRCRAVRGLASSFAPEAVALGCRSLMTPDECDACLALP